MNCLKLNKSLKTLRKNFIDGKFKLTDKYEDCHSAIEFYLINELGDLGKKVHTGRSRNDQVMVAMRLFAKKNLIEFKTKNKLIAETFLNLAKKHKDLPMPGYYASSKSHAFIMGIMVFFICRILH